VSPRPRTSRGRPQDAPGGGLSDLRALMDAAVRPDDWLAIIGGQVEAARGGDARAAQLLLQYRWGKPTLAAPDEPRTLITELVVVPPPDD
jgi:hypothetical protein